MGNGRDIPDIAHLEAGVVDGAHADHSGGLVEGTFLTNLFQSQGSQGGTLFGCATEAASGQGHGDGCHDPKSRP